MKKMKGASSGRMMTAGAAGAVLLVGLGLLLPRAYLRYLVGAEARAADDEAPRVLRAMVEMAQKQQAKVLLVGMRIPTNYGRDYTDRFWNMYKKLSAQSKIPLVPSTQLPRGDELMDKLVKINRVAKVVKGGRRFAFAALVVVGDQKGRVGFGAGKAREVPEAIRKATDRAKRGMIRVPMKEGRTLHHDVEGHFGAGKVILRSAEAGTGIIAGGPMRAVFETLGIGDVVAKSLGSRNPHNMVKATFAALQRCASPRSVANRRGKKVSDILGKREAPAQTGAEVAADV